MFSGNLHVGKRDYSRKWYDPNATLQNIVFLMIGKESHAEQKQFLET